MIVFEYCNDNGGFGDFIKSLKMYINYSIKNNNKIFDGRVKSVLVPRDRAIDIDDEVDFRVAEMLMREKQGKFYA